MIPHRKVSGRHFERELRQALKLPAVRREAQRLQRSRWMPRVPALRRAAG